MEKHLGKVPWTDFGGAGTDMIHLAHANGLPVGSYRELAEHLGKDFRVMGMDARPMWPGSSPRELRSWRQSAEDIIRFLDERQTGPVIGMGHSFGGVCTLLAANMRPELFKAVVLIEPVVLPWWVYLMNDLMPRVAMERISPVASKALRRRDGWATREAMFSYFREKEFFCRMDDAALWNYVNAVAKEDGDNTVRLAYCKAWEAQVFLTVHDPYAALRQLKQPMLAMRGEHSDTIRAEVWQRWRDGDHNPSHRFVEVAGTGHLLPLEDPRRVAQEVQQFIGWVLPRS